MSTLFAKVKDAIQKYNTLVHYEEMSLKVLGEKREFNKTKSLNAVIDAYKNYLKNDNQKTHIRKLWYDDRGFLRYDPLHIPRNSNIQFTEFTLPESDKE